ncbi:uncharacterized protein H6S33_001806 [Morchella sextelata]|uniref:uncharacterized protein n=1 Tax=Morchella sextelata TaxID=1174677 RepID=UPI001D054D59|nr:uncharacterized protein H6S33_001806 [Morchella sextelata]KAH0608672.1 hypothetical protein H6S33_001806 [Morchella sextelata]
MGVTKTILKNGDGINFPKPPDTVEMHYNGTLPVGTKLADGTVTTEEKKFDSSVDRGEPFCTKIGVGKVIRGEPIARRRLLHIQRNPHWYLLRSVSVATFLLWNASS